MQKLFHISEEQNVEVFRPRRSKAIWNFEKFVWAISDELVHNYYLPRECPRICIRTEDIHFSPTFIEITKDDPIVSHILTSKKWVKRIQSTVLFQYEFDPRTFKLKDRIAGYYVSTEEQVPRNIVRVENIPDALKQKNVNLVFLDIPTLIQIHENILQTTDQFSVIRWGNLEAE